MSHASTQNCFREPPLESVPIEAGGRRVYFLQGEVTRLIKIGVTSGGLRSRLANFRSHSPDELHLILLLPGHRDLERQLHAKFAASRRHGEWFAPTPEIIHFVLESRARSLHTSKSHSEVATFLESYEPSPTSTKSELPRIVPLKLSVCLKGQYDHSRKQNKIAGPHGTCDIRSIWGGFRATYRDNCGEVKARRQGTDEMQVLQWALAQIGQE